MTYAEILASQNTKTWKIQQLILLGFTRTEIARLVTNGNYGFVQNVFAKMRAEGRITQQVAETFRLTSFERRFGVEIETYNVNKSSLIARLRRMGIEVETEAYNHTTRGHWKIVSDASIRGAQAMEIVSPVLVGEAGLEDLKKVCQALKEERAYINKSCGMHIHFDAAQMNLGQWKNLFKNYGKLETLIDSFMPISRRGDNNFYCKSVKKSGWERAIETASNLSEIARFYDRSRYFKINPISFERHNTVEFRQHSGTVEFEKIENWVRFLHNLVEYSRFGVIENGSIEAAAAINQPEVIAYINNRISDLAA